MITDPIQIVLERPDLGPRVFRIFLSGRLTSGDIARKVETVDREDHGCFRLIPEDAVLGGETLKLDEEDRWESGDREGFRRSSGHFTSRAIPKSSHQISSLL